MFSQAERCHYQKPQLMEVLCQLRFPTILKIENESPYQFQEKIRDEYPNYSLNEDKNTNGKTQIVTKNHTFLSLDGRWKVNLACGFISLSTRSYGGWEEFAQRLDKLLVEFIGVYHPACFQRIGLRYINAIRKEVLGLADVGWRELITPPFLGLMAEASIPEKAFLKDEQSVALSLPGGAKANVKSGPGLMRLVHNVTHDVKELPVYMLDLDTYMDGNTELSHVASVLNILHDNADDLFRGAITETLHDALEPQPI